MDHLAEQYINLKRQEKLIKSRIEKLRERLTARLLADPNHYVDTASGRLKLQTRVGKPKVDDHILEQLLVDKNLHIDAMKRVVDHDAVEQLYLNGKLTDDDLRSIGVEPTVTLALIVEEIDECTKE